MVTLVRIYDLVKHIKVVIYKLIFVMIHGRFYKYSESSSHHFSRDC